MHAIVLSLLLLLATHCSATLYASIANAKRAVDETSGVVFDPLMTGAARHIVSYAAGNYTYGVVVAALDSSLYEISYPGGNVRKICAPIQSFVLDSFVLHVPSRTILALDISGFKLRMISFDSGAWLGDLMNVPPGVGLYVTTLEAGSVSYSTGAFALFLSAMSGSVVYYYQISVTNGGGGGALSLLAGPVRVTTPALLMPTSMQVLNQSTAYVLSSNNILMVYTFTVPTIWQLSTLSSRNTIQLPTQSFSYHVSRFVVYSDGNVLIPESNCAQVFLLQYSSSSVSMRPLRGLDSSTSPYRYLVSPYALTLASWDPSLVLVSDAVPYALQWPL